MLGKPIWESKKFASDYEFLWVRESSEVKNLYT